MFWGAPKYNKLIDIWEQVQWRATRDWSISYKRKYCKNI